MAISTARLMVIEDWLDSVGDSAHHEARDAIRELIAIKEAEPVAYSVQLENSEVVLQTMNVVKGYLGGRDGVVTPLIRKPE